MSAAPQGNCSTCGAAAKPGARFCGACGASLGATATALEPTPSIGRDATPPPQTSRPNATLKGPLSRDLMIGISVFAVLIAAALGWVTWSIISGRDRSAENMQTVAGGQALPSGRQTVWVTRTTRLRDGPSAEGTIVLADLQRGDRLEGEWIIGSDGETPWLRTEWQGRPAYAWGRNLAYQERPTIVADLGGTLSMAAGAVLRDSPSEDAAALDTLSAPLDVQAVADVGGGWVEIARAGGGVGYVRREALSQSSIYGPAIVFTGGDQLWADQRCDQAADRWRCMLQEMNRLGASDQAVMFASHLETMGNPGWAASFEEHGTVDLVFTAYPLRANTNGAYLMVTADGQIFQAESFEPTTREWSSSAVMAIRRLGQDVFLLGHQGLDRVTDREGGGTVFIYTDVLGECRACEPLGWVRFSFEFDRDGRFLGTRLLTADRGPPPLQ